MEVAASQSADYPQIYKDNQRVWDDPGNALSDQASGNEGARLGGDCTAPETSQNFILAAKSKFDGAFTFFQFVRQLLFLLLDYK
jgi:hypothetical protein